MQSKARVEGWIERMKIGRLWPVLLLAVTVGCDGSVGVQGRVVDPAGEAVAGSAVSLGRPGDAVRFEAETDAAGCFALGGLVAPGERDYSLTVSAAEYKTFEGSYRSTGEYTVLVRLAAEASAGDSTAETLSTQRWATESERCSEPPSTGSTGEGVDHGPDPRAALGLPTFEDYPATELFAGRPAAVDLESHPDGRMFRTALTRDAATGAEEARFAGHYRVVVIGCGTSCRSVWAVDLKDGSLHSLFTASTGVAFRPDSRLIVENDPAYYESLLAEMTPAEVEEQMDTYGPPRFWVENDGDFERVGPDDVQIDPRTKRLVAAATSPGDPS